MAMGIINSTEDLRHPLFTTLAARRGAVAALPFIASNGAAGIVMGVAYKGLGLGFLPAVLFSLIVYSATAQAVILGMWSVPPPATAMVVACIVTNARYLLMGVHLRQLFAEVPLRKMLPTLFLLADASWLMTTADSERNGPDAGYLLGSSIPMAIGWIGGTALGYGLPLQPAGALSVAAALLPLAFIVTLLPTQWRGLETALPWSVAAVTAMLVTSLVGQSWAMLIGGSAGTLISFIRGDDV